MALHWLIALIILGNLVGGLTLDWFFDGGGPARAAWGATIIGFHKALGLLVILLTLARIGWRLGHRPPPLPAHMTPFEVRLAHGTHILFYGLMLALPLSGWAMISTGEKVRPISMFGVVDVPPLPLPQAWGDLFHESHELLGWVMVGTLALHILAAIKHQVFDRDNLLARMLPGHISR